MVNPLLKRLQGGEILAFPGGFEVLPKALYGVEFRTMGRLKEGNDVFGPLNRLSPMGGCSVELHHHHRVAEGTGEVIQKLLKMGLIQVGVGLAPMPSTHWLNHPIEPEGFTGPIHLSDRLDALGGNHPRGLGFAPNPAFVLHQIANRRQIQHRLQSYQGETEVF